MGKQLYANELMVRYAQGGLMDRLGEDGLMGIARESGTFFTELL